jgi:hypothetical protein
MDSLNEAKFKLPFTIDDEVKNIKIELGTRKIGLPCQFLYHWALFVSWEGGKIYRFELCREGFYIRSTCSVGLGDYKWCRTFLGNVRKSTRDLQDSFRELEKTNGMYYRPFWNNCQIWVASFLGLISQDLLFRLPFDVNYFCGLSYLCAFAFFSPVLTFFLRWIFQI